MKIEEARATLVFVKKECEGINNSLSFWLGFKFRTYREIWAVFKATPGWQNIDDQEGKVFKHALKASFKR